MKKDKIKKLLKYLLQLSIVFISARYIPKRELDFKDILIISMISAIAFAVLDMYCPSISCIGQEQLSSTIGYKTLM